MGKSMSEQLEHTKIASLMPKPISKHLQKQQMRTRCEKRILFLLYFLTTPIPIMV